MKKYRPFQFWYLEKHEAWLSDMARQGWHYKGQDMFGMQEFEQGASAEAVYCWDQAPRDKRDAPPYRQQRREAGWELAGSAGRWFCWKKPLLEGQPAPSLRDAAGTRAVFTNAYRHQLAMVFMYAVLLCLQVPHLVSNPAWFRLFLVAGMAAAWMYFVHGALRTRARLRTVQAA